MNKNIICALLTGVVSGVLIYKLTEKLADAIKKRALKKNHVFPAYPLKRKDPYAWGDYTL